MNEPIDVTRKSDGSAVASSIIGDTSKSCRDSTAVGNSLRVSTVSEEPTISDPSFKIVSKGLEIILSHVPQSVCQDLIGFSKRPHALGVRQCLAIFSVESRKLILREFVKAGTKMTPISISAKLHKKESSESGWMKICAVPLKLSRGQISWSGFMFDVDVNKNPEMAPTGHSDLLALAVDLEATFMDSSFERMDHSIEASLGKLGEFFDLDRAFVFFYDFEANTCTNSSEWVSPGIIPFKEVLKEVSLEGMEFWTDAHFAGEFINIPDVNGLPKGAVRQILQMQGIKSVMSVPIFSGSNCIGFVGFGGVRKARAFNKGEISMLLQYSKSLSSFIDGCRNPAEMYHSRDRLLDEVTGEGEYVWEIDLNGCFTYLSGGCVIAFGREYASILGESICRFVPDGLIGSFNGWFLNQLTTLTSFFERKYFVTMDDGSTGLHILSGRPFYDKDKRCLGFRGIARDVTGEKRFVNELNQTRNAIDAFFEVTIDLLLICDQQGKILRLSDSWKSAMGTEIENLIGRNILEFVLEEDLTRTEGELSELQVKRSTINYVNRWSTATGRSITLEWNAAVCDGLVFASAREITNSNIAEALVTKALEVEKQSEIIKERLIAMASHELRTPLAAIRLAAELLQSRFDTANPWASEKLNTIISRCDLLENIISDVLELDQNRAHREFDYEPSPRIFEKLSDVLEGLISEFGNDGGRICLDLRDDPTIDSNLVGRILRNLLSNALKFSPQHENILVESTSSDGCVEICVVDKGPGISEEEVELVFNEFFRGHGTEFIRGTGLGLAIARDAARRIGGEISYSRGRDKLTIFRLKLPKKIDYE